MSGPDLPGWAEPPFALTAEASDFNTLRCSGCGDAYVVDEDDRGNLAVGCSCPPDTEPRRRLVDAGGWPVRFRVAEDPLPPIGRDRGAGPGTEMYHGVFSVEPPPTAVERLREDIHERVDAARRDGRVVSAVVVDAERYGWLAADEARRTPDGATTGVPDPGDAYGFAVKALQTRKKTLRLLFEDDSRTMSEHYTDGEPEEQGDD